MSAKCKFLSIADECFSGDGETWAREAAFHCTWSMPLAEGKAPVWFRKLVGGGHLVIDPADTCTGCQAYQKAEPI